MAKRSGKIKTGEDDAVEFIQQVNSILESLVDDLDIGEVVFVKIKNWFGPKWLNYSGKSIVHFPGIIHLDSGREESLESVWLKAITIPPFNPNRILSSRYVRVEDTGNKRIESTAHGYRRSTETRRHLVQDYTKDGILLWYSSNTLVNQKGSLKIYISQNDQVKTWYAQFENIGRWRITKTKGINMDELHFLANDRRSVVA